jgi:hypothetical protein
MRTCLLLAVVLLAPPATAEPAAPPVPSDADFAAHAAALRTRLPEGFTVLVERPFVVIGDEAPDMVQRRVLSLSKHAALVNVGDGPCDPHEGGGPPSWGLGMVGRAPTQRFPGVLGEVGEVRI